VTIFSSARLDFRKICLEDVTPRYVSWLNDPQINRFLETRHSVQDHDAVYAFVAEQMANPNVHLLKITLRSEGLHIGNIKVGPINRHHASAQISLFIGEKNIHGKGYGAEAIERVTKWAFESAGLERIEAGCYEDNLASLRAFLKAGYAVEGFRRKAYVSADGRRTGAFLFACLASEYQRSL
jgi:ribosomal-protein-alanine N-acetyltransferase